MNCVLHFLKNENEVSILENNYDILSSSIKNQFVMSFVPNIIPNRQFEQLFYKKLNNIDTHQEEYSRYFFLYQINRFLQSKNYKRLFFIASTTALKPQSNFTDILNEIDAFGPDFIKFKKDGLMYEDIFLARISLLDTNLDYANCKYEIYCNRQRYNNYDIYLRSPFEIIKDLKEYV